MMKNLKHYKILANMFRYPDESMRTYSEKFLEMIQAEFPDKYAEIKKLTEAHNCLSMKEQQECYLKTFDVQAICYLDIGYVLFGEDYKRAQLLVNLQNEHKNAGVDCGSELGDHLPNVLTLLSKTTDPDFAEELGFIVTMPAVRFMITKFKDIQNNYYKDLLAVLFEFLQRDFPGEGLHEYAVPEQAFSGDREFVLPSPKSAICDTLCHKRKSI
jgi:nitrate reductase assembly molybdenum cofactor insertion protein NarJ